MKAFGIILITLAIAKHSFAQDTTGGTRPTILIPLHKSPAKKMKTQIPVSTTALSAKGTPSLNATDSKLRAAAMSKKYRRRESVKKVKHN